MTDRTGIYRLFALGVAYDFAQSTIRSRQSRREFFARFVQPMPGMRVLDFGCGTGDALRYLPTVEYCGIDANADYLSRARRQFPRNAEFVLGDVHSLEAMPTGEYDLVLALGVLHHLDDTLARETLAQFSRILRHDGRFVSHDPVVAEQQGSLARWFVQHDRGRHVRTIDGTVRIARTAFRDVVNEVVARPLRIPFTEIALVCSDRLSRTPECRSA
jgi:SAM-dependent methyltransferase